MILTILNKKNTMEQRKNKEPKELNSQTPQFGRAGRINEGASDIKNSVPSEEHIEKNERKGNMPQFMIILVVLFVFAGMYALYNIIFSSFKMDTKDSVIKTRAAVKYEMTRQFPISDIPETAEIEEIPSGKVSQQNTFSITDNRQQGDFIGKWKDAATGFFYELYKKNGKIFLNFSDIKTISCNFHKLKKNEYKFRDNENGLFGYADGVEVYVGKGFEECFDIDGNRYMSDVILRIQDKQLYVYSNDYDRNVYDELCIALR